MVRVGRKRDSTLIIPDVVRRNKTIPPAGHRWWGSSASCGNSQLQQASIRRLDGPASAKSLPSAGSSIAVPSGWSLRLEKVSKVVARSEAKLINGRLVPERNDCTNRTKGRNVSQGGTCLEGHALTVRRTILMADGLHVSSRSTCRSPERYAGSSWDS